MNMSPVNSCAVVTDPLQQQGLEFIVYTYIILYNIHIHIHYIYVDLFIYIYIIYKLYILYIPINRNKRHNDEKTHQQPTRLPGVLSLKARPEEFHPPETADPGVPW